MKAVGYAGHGVVGLTEVARPVLQQPDDVVLRVEAAAICGSDIHLIQGHMGALPVGTVLGHEFVGVVEEVGPAVTRFAVGDRAVGACTTACGDCWYCRRGFHCQCPDRSAFGHGPLIGQEIPGGQAEYVRVPAAHTNLHSVPNAVGDDQAIFVGDILATAYVAIQNADLRPGDIVAVIGCGPVGLLVAECARLFGAAAVIVIDTVDRRLEQAQREDALTINSSRTDPVAEARDLTEGRGPDAVVDAAGGSATLRLALELVRPRGVVSVVGVPSDAEYTFPAGPIMAKEVAVRFGLGDPGLGPRLMTLIAAGRLNPARIISHRLPLSEAAHGYEIFQAREATKVLLVP
jgi:2-desacetyl-2-hydroxyethyl bacteriochlorophyllide A dehydrogenase